jgi:hypothetical protein
MKEMRKIKDDMSINSDAVLRAIGMTERRRTACSFGFDISRRTPFRTAEKLEGNPPRDQVSSRDGRRPTVCVVDD